MEGEEFENWIKNGYKTDASKVNTSTALTEPKGQDQKGEDIH